MTEKPRESLAAARRVLALARDTHKALRHVARYLEQKLSSGAVISDEDERWVLTWHLALCTLGKDVAGDAIKTANAGSLRVARMLNRCLFEYGCRAHHYHYDPSKAAEDGLQANAMGRKIMRPTRNLKGDMTDAQFRAFQVYMDAGSFEVKFPRVHVMMENMLKNFGLSSRDVKQFMGWLDVEYTLGSGLIHGSQLAIWEVFTQPRSGMMRHTKTPHFKKGAELLRATCCMLILIAAVTWHCKRDLGVDPLVERLRALIEQRGKTDIFKHDALLSLFRLPDTHVE